MSTLNKDKHFENIFGINCFSWSNWDEVDTGTLQFYNPIWCFSSMEQYDGQTVTLSQTGQYTIYDDSNGEVVREGYMLEIKEFEEAILEKIRENKTTLKQKKDLK